MRVVGIVGDVPWRGVEGMARVASGVRSAVCEKPSAEGEVLISLEAGAQARR